MHKLNAALEGNLNHNEGIEAATGKIWMLR